MKLAAMVACGAMIAWAAAADAAPKKKKKKPAPPPTPVEEPTPPPDPTPAPDLTPAPPPDPAPVVVVETPVPPPPAESPSHHFYLRAGVVIVAPVSTSQPLELADVNGAASLAVQNGPIAGSGAKVQPALTPGVILGYRLPVRGGKLALETVLGLPFKVTFQATGTLADQSIAPTALGIPTGVPALGSQLGTATAAPPLITAVYWFDKLGPIHPLVGAGVAALFASGGKITNPILSEVSQPSFHISPAVGFVVQAGAEVKLSRLFYLRLDVKYIAFLEAKATVENIQVNTPGLPLFQTVEVGTAKMNVDVNPFVIQLGLGFDFW